MTKPDYNNCILNITNSLLKHYGARPFQATLPMVDKMLAKPYQNVVLLVLDGLGVNVLKKHLPPNAFLTRYIKAEISSVFPPTTVAATTSLLTGKTPAQHGWIGWSCYFKEIDKCVDLYSNLESGTKKPAAEAHQAYTHLSCDSFLDVLADKVRTCAVWPYSQEHFAETMPDICTQLKKLCHQDGNKLIYAYCTQPDHDMHYYGISPARIQSLLQDFDRQLEALTDALRDTLLIITADHGMTDIAMKCVEAYPQINDALVRPISLESRCCSFYVKDAYKSAFPTLFNETFPGKFKLYTHDEFLQSGLLGKGTKHPRVKDFCGDYVAAAISDIGLWYKDINGEYHDFKASHAGLTQEELIVPLIAVERP